MLQDKYLIGKKKNLEIYAQLHIINLEIKASYLNR